MQDGEDGELGVDQLADQLQQVGLVEEVEVRAGLVEEDQAWLLGQDPGDADKLLFASRQLGKWPLLQMEDAHPLQAFNAHGHVLRLGHPGDVAGTAGEDHVLHRKGENRPVVLGKIAQDAGTPPGGEGADFLPHDLNLASIEVEETCEYAHEGGLPAAVFAEQDGELPRRDLQRHPVEDRHSIVGEGEILDLDRRF